MLIQAGQSGRGQKFAARWADLVFVIFHSLKDGIREYAAFKEGSEEPVKKWAPADIDPTKQGIPDTIPTTDFAPGNYRLDIKLTDKGSSKTLSNSVKFVIGS